MSTVPVYTMRLVRESPAPYHVKVSSPFEVANVVQSMIGHEARENFLVFSLNTKNTITGLFRCSVGTVNSAIVKPREVFAFALKKLAMSIVVAHNHPSGDVTPSPEDREITKALKQIGELHGIKLLDHIIVGPGGERYSFLESGSM